MGRRRTKKELPTKASKVVVRSMETGQVVRVERSQRRLPRRQPMANWEGALSRPGAPIPAASDQADEGGHQTV